MSASNQLAVYLPFVLGALLIGTVVAGAGMTIAGRLRFERLVLLPVLIVALAAAVYAALHLHNWAQAGFIAFMGILAAIRLYYHALGGANHSGRNGASG